jgi:dTDP-4-dehydrorhamnose reductase
VMRVGCLYGRGGRNFPSTIARRLRAGETIKAVGDRIGSPTWVVPVVGVSAALARTEHFGLYHCTANGETTWADYARFLADALGVPATRVTAVASGALPLKAPRPRRAVLDNRMLRLRGLDTLGDWQTQAREFLASEAGP